MIKKIEREREIEKGTRKRRRGVKGGGQCQWSWTELDWLQGDVCGCERERETMGRWGRGKGSDEDKVYAL